MKIRDVLNHCQVAIQFHDNLKHQKLNVKHSIDRPLMILPVCLIQSVRGARSLAYKLNKKGDTQIFGKSRQTPGQRNEPAINDPFEKNWRWYRCKLTDVHSVFGFICLVKLIATVWEDMNVFFREKQMWYCQRKHRDLHLWIIILHSIPTNIVATTVARYVFSRHHLIF